MSTARQKPKGPSPSAAAELAALHERLSTARTEIETALNETGRAANTILNHAETLLGGDQALDSSQVGIGIMEACSFQDLTGQRLRKALAALERIVAEIERHEYGLGLLKDDPDYAQWQEANLVHGPAAEGQALGQSAIDDLFNDTK